MTVALRSPISWIGGKGLLRKKIIDLMPPHREYVEPFGGGASVLLAKEPALVETYNDIDSHIVNFFRVLRDHETFERFYHMALLTPYSRQEFEEALVTWRSEPDSVMRAYLWWIRARQSFSGSFISGWSRSRKTSACGMAKAVSAMLGTIDKLPEVMSRLQRVQIENQDWRKVLATHNSETTLAYCDPPYVLSTRKHSIYYGKEGSHEMTTEDHRELVARLLLYPGMVMLSGYEHPIYDPFIECAWHITKWQTSSSAVPRTEATGIVGLGSASEKAPRTEVLYRNPAAMSAIVSSHEGVSE